MGSLRFLPLKNSWPSAFVAREKVGVFSGGIINPRTLANADSAGIGPKEKIRVGRKIAYPVDALIAWLEAKVVEG
jgi:hypothetical protein